MFDLDFEQTQGKIKEIIKERWEQGIAAGVRAIMLLSKEGLPITSEITTADLEEAEIAAMAASILGVADMAAVRMDQGELEQVLMTNEKGYIVITSAGEKAILVLAAAKSSRTGALVYEAKTMADKIAPLL
jgi:hypothetical protein